jgi:hypothetical protein
LPSQANPIRHDHRAVGAAIPVAHQYGSGAEISATVDVFGREFLNIEPFVVIADLPENRPWHTKP